MPSQNEIVQQKAHSGELALVRDRLLATQEILQIISQNREDQQPVFEAILKNAAKLCDVPVITLMLLDETRSTFHVAAHLGDRKIPLEPNAEWSLQAPLPIAQSLREARTVHVADMKSSEPYLKNDPTYRRLVDGEGMRTRLSVPLLHHGITYGAIVLTRLKQQPFDEDEIKLIESFADQAVIALENFRQFREVQTRLERETATKNILSAISRSSDDELPVFDAILANATLLCNAPIAALVMVDDARKKYELVASSGANPEFVDAMKKHPPDLDPERFAAARAIVEKCVVHVEDLAAPALYGAEDEHRIVSTQTEGIRTTLFVPLIWDEQSIGAIGLWRREVKPFQADEISLIETFSAQAVIAIENVRQFREVQERLAREAATSEVLKVISQSRSDAQPVFRTILENAARLCSAPHAMLLLCDAQDEYLVLAANNAAQSVFIDQIRDMPHRLDNTESYAVRAVLEQRVIHVHDLRETASVDKVPQIKVALELEGMRTVLQVPLLRGDRAIGVIALYKLEVAPFTDDQVKLVETFANQAVIAIENTNQMQNLEALNAELGDRVEEQVGEIERMGKLKRFLPAAVADTVISSGSEDMLKSHRALLGVLFCDIRGFTAFCETAEPEETIEVLQTYHEEMGKLINAHSAGVDHRMGDGIMVLFNDPLPCEDPAGDAVRLAIAMQTMMSELCRAWKRMGYRLGFGVGISLGFATVGIVGFEGRSDYTASGTAINLASRLCDEAEDGEILLSTRAAIAVEDDFASVSVGEVTLKGIREPVEVFKLANASET